MEILQRPALAIAKLACIASCANSTADSGWLQDGKLFCVKMYHADMMSEKDKQDVKNEAAILATLNHPNIVQYQETYTVRLLTSFLLYSACCTGLRLQNSQ